MKKILIVEDSPVLAQALSSMLPVVIPGVVVEHTDDGIVALRKIKEGTVSLVILDLVLESMDGFQLIEELIRQNIPANVFMVALVPTTEDREKALGMGVLGYFAKDEEGIRELVQSTQKLLSA